MHDPKLVVENEVIVVFNQTAFEEKGREFRVTAINFLRNGQSWKIATSRTKVAE